MVFGKNVNQGVIRKCHMTASVSVVCYKSKTLSDGKSPLLLQVWRNGKRKYQSLGISIDPKYWDFTKDKPKPNCPNGDYIQKIIPDKITEVKKHILIFSADQKDYSRVCGGKKILKMMKLFEC